MFDNDRAGRPKVRRVQLRTEAPAAHPERPDGLLTDADWCWATSAPRRWTTVQARFGAGDAFSPGSREIIARMAQRHDGVGELASACLRRGYGIEQEAPVRGALRRLLASAARGGLMPCESRAGRGSSTTARSG